MSQVPRKPLFVFVCVSGVFWGCNSLKIELKYKQNGLITFLLIWIILFGIKLSHHTFVIPHHYSMSWFGPRILTYSGLELIRPGSPSVGGSGNESIGLEFVHFRVVILMQIVLRFSKEGLVSFILSNGLCQKFTRVFIRLYRMLFYKNQMFIQK